NLAFFFFSFFVPLIFAACSEKFVFFFCRQTLVTGFGNFVQDGVDLILFAEWLGWVAGLGLVCVFYLKGRFASEERSQTVHHLHKGLGEVIAFSELPDEQKSEQCASQVCDHSSRVGACDAQKIQNDQNQRDVF